MKLKEYVIKNPNPVLKYGFQGKIYKINGTLVGIDIEDVLPETTASKFIELIKQYIEPTDWKWVILINSDIQYPLFRELFNLGILLKLKGMKGYEYALCSDKNAQYVLSYLGKDNMEGIEYNSENFDPSKPLSKLGELKGKEIGDITFKTIGNDKYEAYSGDALLAELKLVIRPLNEEGMNDYPNYLDLKSLSLKESARGNNIFMGKILPSLIRKAQVVTIPLQNNRFGEKIFEYVKSGKMSNVEWMMATPIDIFLINKESPNYDTISAYARKISERKNK